MWHGRFNQNCIKSLQSHFHFHASDQKERLPEIFTSIPESVSTCLSFYTSISIEKLVFQVN